MIENPLFSENSEKKEKDHRKYMQFKRIDSKYPNHYKDMIHIDPWIKKESGPKRIVYTVLEFQEACQAILCITNLPQRLELLQILIKRTPGESIPFIQHQINKTKVKMGM